MPKWVLKTFLALQACLQRTLERVEEAVCCLVAAAGGLAGSRAAVAAGGVLAFGSTGDRHWQRRLLEVGLLVVCFCV